MTKEEFDKIAKIRRDIDKIRIILEGMADGEVSIRLVRADDYPSSVFCDYKDYYKPSADVKEEIDEILKRAQDEIKRRYEMELAKLEAEFASFAIVKNLINKISQRI